MRIEELISLIKNNKNGVVSRGSIIDYIADNTQNWILVLKALLIKNPNKYINNIYLLEKLNFMKNNEDDPHSFLDFQGLNIFRALKGL